MKHRLSMDRYPFEIFMLVLCVISGIPLLLGHIAPTSVNEQVPRWAVYVWGTFLSGGSALALTGIAWPRRPTGIAFEQVGLVAAGFAALFYALCIVVSIGSGGLVAAGLTAGFGLSCLWQWRLLNNLLRAYQSAAREH